MRPRWDNPLRPRLRGGRGCERSERVRWAAKAGAMEPAERHLTLPSLSSRATGPSLSPLRAERANSHAACVEIVSEVIE